MDVVTSIAPFELNCCCPIRILFLLPWRSFPDQVESRDLDDNDAMDMAASFGLTILDNEEEDAGEDRATTSLTSSEDESGKGWHCGN